MATGLWFGGATMGVVAALVMLMSLDTLESTVRGIVERDFPNEASMTRDRVVALASAVLIGGGLLVGFAQMGAAAAMRSGRGAARFALVTLLGVAVVEMLLSLEVVSIAGRVALLLSISLGVVGSVLMYLPTANLWFSSQRS